MISDIKKGYYEGFIAHEVEDILPKENRINIEIKYNLDGNRFFRIF